MYKRQDNIDVGLPPPPAIDDRSFVRADSNWSRVVHRPRVIEDSGTGDSSSSVLVTSINSVQVPPPVDVDAESLREPLAANSSVVLMEGTPIEERVPTAVGQFLDYSDQDLSDNLVDLPVADPEIFQGGGGSTQIYDRWQQKEILSLIHI